jgi:ABC-2 type transport system ATP-binding protein
MENSIEVVGLVKKYPTQKGAFAVNDLTLSIPKGQLFGLIGPDGSGKTTTLRILSTVMRHTSGSVKVLGYELPRHAEEVRPKIGYMPQNFSLYPDLSVIENLNFFADLNQVRGPERLARIESALEKWPRLALAGNGYRGIGIPDCIHSGELAALNVLTI